MRRRQRHHELAVAGGYSVPSLVEPRGSVAPHSSTEPVRAPLPGEYHTADGKRPCPNCGARFRAGAMHFHLKRCMSEAA